MTTLSGSSLPFVKGFDDYISKSSAHDQDRPGGPSARVEYVSTLGDCAPETYVGDVLRTRLAYGKADLEIDAYSYVLSHSHEELDPADDDMGAVAHRLAREWAQEAWPGRQVKIVTQRDNGRFEGEGDDRRWIEGHWHSHIVVANVAEQEVTLRWQNADGDELVKSYPAGRAIDGDLKNIFRLRRGVDAAVLEHWKYDNAAYVEACRRFSEGAVATQDLAQRAARGYSTYDQVRLKLRTAAAQSTDWDDYVARCQAVAVDVRVRGKGGVSYAWVGDDGLERKARARGKTGIGPEFTRAEVESRCVENSAAIERGEVLEIPEQVLVVPTSTVALDRPRPQYLTPDGKPPWESSQAQGEYLEGVRQSGGTYEGRSAQALVSDEPVEGVELTRDGDSVTATVDAGAGPVMVDVDRSLTARAAALDQREAGIDAEVESRFEARRDKMNEWWRTTGHPEAKRKAADAVREEMADEIAGAEAEAREIKSDAHTEAETISANATAEANRTKEAAERRSAEVDAAILDAVVDLEAAVDEARGRDADPDRIRKKYTDHPLKEGEGVRRVRKCADEVRERSARRLTEAEALLNEIEAAHERAFDPEQANRDMTAAKLDTMRALKGPKRADGSSRTVDEWVDEKTAERYARARQPVPTETLRERLERGETAERTSAATLGKIQDLVARQNKGEDAGHEGLGQ